MATYKNKSRGTPKMARAHFELIASVLKEIKPWTDGYSPSPREVRVQLVQNFASALATTNPAFRRADFLAACGMED